MPWKRPSVRSVVIDDDFWTPYLEGIRTVTLPYVLDKFEETGYVENLDAVAARRPADHKGPPFSDGLLFETVRGACDFLAAHPDAALEARLDQLIGRIRAASYAVYDGYFCTYVTQMRPTQRWGEHGGDIIIQHDLYDHGALIEAAISHYLATGKTTLLDCAVRAAQLVVSVIGPAPKQPIIPGHSLPEEAFIKLYRLFRDTRALDDYAFHHGVHCEDYLAIAVFWYEQRGKNPPVSTMFAPYYHQNHLTFREQTSAVGHSVRASLCYTGAAACAYEMGDTEDAAAYKRALDALWRNVVDKKMHISGGIGTRHDIEGFDVDYNLPNDAYLETCAAIGLAFWGGEMSLLDLNSEYFDVFERALYNNVLAAVSEDFTRYFYENPLTSDGSIRRWAWHGCPCCPPMLLKLYAALGTYIYSCGEDEVSVNMMIGSRLTAEGYEITQKNGEITVRSEKPLTLKLRVPHYAEGFALKLNGAAVPFDIENGYAVLRRAWQADDRLTVEYEAAPHRVYANPEVKDDLGRVAVMKGPMLYCAEGFDNGGNVDLTLDSATVLTMDGDEIEGKTADGQAFRLIPYYRWCRRESERQADRRMSVWFTQRHAPAKEILAKAMNGKLYIRADQIDR